MEMAKQSNRRTRHGKAVPKMPRPRTAAERIGRRQFVRTAGGVLGAAAVGNACREVGSPGSGTIIVNLLGFVTGATALGSATISGGNLATPLVVTLTGPDTFAEVTVEVGTYQVEYEAPSGYTVAPGTGYTVNAQGRGERSVLVQDQQVTEVSFTVAAATGTLRITVTGIQSGAANGGSASVLRTDITGQTPATVNVPTVGTVDTPFAPGTYSVTYTPPSGHLLSAGQTNPQSVPITGGQTGTATFQVQQTGTVRVTVTGIDGGAANGGSASILRTDIGGQTPITANVPLSGTVDTPRLPGTYSVTYTPPSGRRLVAGQTNPQNVTIAGGAVGTATFQIEVSPIPSGVVFHSDWRSGTGTSSNALRDTSQTVPWPTLGPNNPGVLEVVAATGLDFPTATVVKVTALDRGDGGARAQSVSMLGSTAIPGLPSNGSMLFYRWYIRNTAPEPFPSTDDLNHNIENGNAGQNWLMESVVNDNGTWTLRWSFEGTGFPSNRFICPALTKGVTYRIELQIQRLSATTFNAHTRVYNDLVSTTVPLYDDDDFVNSNSSGSLASTPTLSFAMLSVMNELQMGFNGLSMGGGITGANDEFVHSYFGGAVVRTDDWCGPYSGGI